MEETFGEWLTPLKIPRNAYISIVRNQLRESAKAFAFVYCFISLLLGLLKDMNRPCPLSAAAGPIGTLMSPQTT